MIVRIFKTNQVYIYAFIPLVLLALRWPVFFNDPPFTPAGQLPLFRDFFAWLVDYPFLSLFLGILCISYQAYILAEISNEHRLVPYSSNLAAFVLAISYSIFAPQDWFSPVVFANVFVVLALRKVIGIFHQGHIYSSLFRAGIYISLGSLIYFPVIFMLLIVYYGLGIIRTFNWREYVIPIVGLITPNIYMLAYYYLNGEAMVFLNYFIEPKTFLTFIDFKWINWLPGMIISLWAIVSVFYLLTSGRKRTVRENNLYKIIGAMLAMGVFLSLIFHTDFMSASGLIWPALALILTYQTLGISRRWLQEGVFYVLVISILARDLLQGWF